MDDARAALGGDVLTDLEMFVSYTNSEEHTVVRSLLERGLESRDHVRTLATDGAYDEFKRRLQTPYKCAERLTAYQQRIEHLRTRRDPSRLRRVRDTHPHMIWLRNERSDNKDGALDATNSVYFKYRVFDRMGCNDRRALLNMLNAYNIVVSPCITIISPIIYFILPYIVIVRKFRMRFSFKEFLSIMWRAVKVLMLQNGTVAKVQIASFALSLFLYGHGVLGSVSIARDAYKVARYLYERVEGVGQHLRAGLALLEHYEPPDLVAAVRRSLDGLEVQGHWADVGARLVDFRALKNRADFRLFTAKVDTLVCDLHVVDLSANMIPVSFLKGPSPIIRLTAMQHPCINDGVPNDVRIDGDNWLITGPNAAGKSTLVKAIACNILIAQTIGYVFAKEAEITPFAWICTHINIPDCKGIESLFQAEMNRCGACVDVVRSLPSTHNALIVLDEIFNSTNVVEGISGAYAILDTLSHHPNACTLITTHYPYLAKLRKFDKMRMDADLSNGISFPYKLQRGVSRQYIAVEMLREKFDPVIVEKALSVKRSILGLREKTVETNTTTTNGGNDEEDTDGGPT